MKRGRRGDWARESEQGDTKGGKVTGETRTGEFSDERIHGRGKTVSIASLDMLPRHASKLKLRNPTNQWARNAAREAADMF